jgi:D-alanine-D-alanine ligase
VKAAAKLGARVIIKPASHGSSVGVTVARNREEIVSGIQKAYHTDDRVLIEEFISGTEVQVGILGNWRDYRVLPTLELDFQDGQEWFDPETKYGEDRSRIVFRIPARITEAASQRMINAASKLYEAYQLTGYARFDFIASENRVVALEVNTITGMTPTSTYPLMAQHVGIEYPSLLSRLINFALVGAGT